MIAQRTASRKGPGRGIIGHVSRRRGWRKAPFILLSGAARALDRAGRASMCLATATLPLQDLREAIGNTWEAFGRSERAILSGLMPWERALYDGFLKPADRILVVGCGTGRDLIALLKLGYRAAGLDVVPGAITAARAMLDKEGLPAELYTGGIEVVALPGSFDVVTFSWCCYGYIPQADARIGVLRKVKAHLTPGGRILISYLPAERPPRALPIHLMRFVARVTGADWHPESGDVIGSATEDRNAVRYEHQFGEGELEREARAAGLTVVFHERDTVGTAVLIV
jgi:SAM-dependent methyltransferase